MATYELYEDVKALEKLEERLKELKEKHEIRR